MTSDQELAAFEACFSKPPFEWNFKRRGAESAWPGSYLKLEQEYAWQGFKMALELERSKGRERAKAVTDQEQEAFDLTYNRVFRGQTADTKKLAECELIWQAALEWERSRTASEGWQLVPKDPTVGMFIEMVDPFIAVSGDNRTAFAQAYKAMLAAAPQPFIRNSRNTQGDNHE